MAELRVNGIRVHYRESGGGAPVALLHAGGSSGAQWRRVGERLDGRYRLLALDFHGHGGTSPWPGRPETRTHDNETVLVQALIDDLAEPTHLVAHSYGAAVAVRLMLGEPRGIRSLFLLEPVIGTVLRDGSEVALCDEYLEIMRRFIVTADAGEAERAWAEYLAANEAPGTWEGMHDDARQRLLAVTALSASVCHANLNHDKALADCARIAGPTTLAYGDRTKARYRRTSELLAGAIPGASLRVVPGAAHMSPLTHPDAVAEALAAHLDAN